MKHLLECEQELLREGNLEQELVDDETISENIDKEIDDLLESLIISKNAIKHFKKKKKGKSNETPLVESSDDECTVELFEM